MHTYSYRDFEAYWLARHLLGDPTGQGASASPSGPQESSSSSSDRLSRTALSLAMNLVDGTQCEDAAERRDHLKASLDATDELAQLILECRREGQLEETAAEELLALQRRALISLRASLTS